MSTHNYVEMIPSEKYTITLEQVEEVFMSHITKKKDKFENMDGGVLVT